MQNKMADVSQCFSLCKGFKKDSLLGIEKHCDKNHVILTFKDRGVLVYNVSISRLFVWVQNLYKSTV